MSALPQGLNDAYLDDRRVPTEFRKAPQREGATDIGAGLALFELSRGRIDQDIAELKKSFHVFGDDAVDQFLRDHRALPGVLREAVGPLRASFGPDCIFRLEVSTDEDDSKMLYGVVLWKGTVRAAAQALDDFAETWWLDHMTPATTDLAFVYRISR